MKNQFFNYLNNTWIVRKLKRFGIMNRPEPEIKREALLLRKLKEYNLIRAGASKMNRKSRDFLVKEIEDLARKGIVTIAPVKEKPIKTVMDVV